METSEHLQAIIDLGDRNKCGSWAYLHSIEWELYELGTLVAHPHGGFLFQSFDSDKKIHFYNDDVSEVEGLHVFLKDTNRACSDGAAADEKTLPRSRKDFCKKQCKDN